MPQISLSEPDGHQCQFVNKQKRERAEWKGNVSANRDLALKWEGETLEWQLSSCEF